MRNTIQLKCEFCKKIFNRVLCDYQYPDGKIKNKYVYCSRNCRTKEEDTRIEIPCGYCSNIVNRHKRYIHKSKSGYVFCNRSCAASFNNKLKRKSRRSKIEKRFYNLLKKEFPNLDILPNDKTMLDGLEVDIAIPSLKLAIEWNGIVHFKPIYGQNKLNKIQTKDTEKLKIASNKDINLIVISDLVSNETILKQSFKKIKVIISNLLI